MKIVKKQLLAALVTAAACGMAAGQATAPTTTTHHGLFPTGSLFDLTVGVGSSYNPSTDTISGGSVTAPVGFSTVEDLFDHVTNSGLRSANSAYTPTSAAVIRLGYRGLPATITTTAGSPVVRFSVPAINENVVFDSFPTRDQNVDQLEQYLKDHGGDILSRMQRAMVKYSPVDPLAGNPASLQYQMVAGDFDRAFTQTMSQIGDGGGNVNNLIGIGLSIGSFSVAGIRQQTVTVPLSYTMRNDLDPRKQLTFYAPITLTDAEGAKGVAVNFGTSYRYPINDNWAVIPAIGYGITGSVDLGSAAAMLAASVTSVYALKFTGFDVAIGNAVGVYRSDKFKANGYSYDPSVRNTVFRNGVLVSVPTVFMDQRMAYEISFINTIFNGTDLFSDRYNEIGFTLGTNRSATSARSFVRAGITYLRGNNGVKGGRLNVGYWF